MAALLAALDEVSRRRMERYAVAISEAATPEALAEVAARIFREDLEHGDVGVLVEMMAAATTSPELGEAVSERIAPWLAFTRTVLDEAVGTTALASVIPIDDAAYAVVALYLGLELLSHLDGDRSRALALFEGAGSLVRLFTPTITATGEG